MALPEIDPSSLAVLVFGPGTGELICVHAPPGRWLVVDGCRKFGATSYSTELLSHYGARPSIIVLTHPHTDHASGLAELVEQHTRDDAGEWPLLGMVLPPDTRGAGSGSDDQAAYEGGVAERAVATILDRWDRRPECRWELPAGDRRALGDAEVLVLGPEADQLDEAREKFAGGELTDPNHLASALSVEWEGRRVVLGSDLDPATAWAAILQRDPDCADHVGIKVPHHGSVTCLLDRLFGRAVAAPRIVTPFARQNLPRFGGDGGIAFLHQTAPEVHVTALPRKYSGQGGAGGERFTRAALEPDGRHLAREPKVPGFPDCYIVVQWSPSAEEPTLHYGAGSLIVER